MYDLISKDNGQKAKKRIARSWLAVEATEPDGEHFSKILVTMDMEKVLFWVSGRKRER